MTYRLAFSPPTSLLASGKAAILFAIAAMLAAIVPHDAAAQSSNAARYLQGEAIADACRGGAGSLDPRGLIERDLDGDGEVDLVISHEWIECMTGGQFSRSFHCGMQVCTVLIYLRRGQLLQLTDEFLGGGVEVGPGQVPEITGFAHGGGTWSIRWNGREFE